MVVGKSPCTKIKCINFCPIFPIYLNLNGIVLRFIYIDLNMKKNVKSYYLWLAKQIQYSAGCPSQNNAFAVFNAEESLHLQLGATWRWKKNIFNWSWGRRSLLKDCTVKDQPLIMIVFMRSIQRLWVLRELLTRDKDLMQYLFQILCLDQFWKEERYGVVICNLVGSKKCKFRSAPRAIILCQRRKTNRNAGQSNIIVSRTLFQFLLCSCSCCLDSIVSICKHLVPIVVKLYIQSIVLLAQVWQDVSKSHLRPCCTLATWWETDKLYNTLYTSKQAAILNCIEWCKHYNIIHTYILNSF